VTFEHTPDGPGDDACGCATSAVDPPIACTLDDAERPERIAAWQAVLAAVEARESIDGGVRLRFRSSDVAGDVAALAAAEQHCCSFFRFSLTIDGRGTALEVTAPPDAIALVHSLFGSM